MEKDKSMKQKKGQKLTDKYSAKKDRIGPFAWYILEFLDNAGISPNELAQRMATASNYIAVMVATAERQGPGYTPDYKRYAKIAQALGLEDIKVLYPPGEAPADTVLAVMKGYKVDLSDDEKELLRSYRKLRKEPKRTALRFLKWLDKESHDSEK